MTHNMASYSGRWDAAIELLEKVHEERRPFSMHRWITYDDGSCGTIACAGGWMALDREFQNAGLWPVDDGVRYSGSIECQGHRGFAALGAFFGINLEQSAFFFDGSRYHGRDHTATAVANRMRMFRPASNTERIGSNG